MNPETYNIALILLKAAVIDQGMGCRVSRHLTIIYHGRTQCWHGSVPYIHNVIHHDLLVVLFMPCLSTSCMANAAN